MIFLPVGTWKEGYNRLLKAVDELLCNGDITEEVIAQTGYSSYKPKNMTSIDFCSPDEFTNMISRSRIVISHAGMGTIIETVKQSKPIIVVPRKADLDEVDNDHQFVTAKQFESENKILVAYEVSDLPAKLKDANTFIPTQVQVSLDIMNTVQKYIDDLIIKKPITHNKQSKNFFERFWPYRLMKKDDDDIHHDLKKILQHFDAEGQVFDKIVFIPNAGIYLH